MVLQHAVRKVPQVSRDDQLSFRRDGSGDNVPIIRIGQLNSLDMSLPAIDFCILESYCHQPEGAVERSRVDLALGQDIAADLGEDG